MTPVSIVSLLCVLLAIQVHAKTQMPLVLDDPQDNSPQMPEIWEVLGPFPVGPRELGADPLSAYGGFEKLPYSTTQGYPSELATGGYVYWRQVVSHGDTVGPVLYNNVRWDFNEGPFGWTSLHHSTYFRSTLHVPKSGIYLVQFANVISFKIDEHAYVGNVYGYDHSSENAIYLEEGNHKLYICAIMDVRINGGHIPPRVVFTGSFIPAETVAEAYQHSVVAILGDSIAPEAMNGQLITPYASVTILNANVSYHGGNMNFGWVQIADVVVTDPTLPPDQTRAIQARIPLLYSLRLAPGQVLPIPIELSVKDDTVPLPKKLAVTIKMMCMDDWESFDVSAGELDLVTREWGTQAYKITFMDFDDSVHYAMVRPPARSCVSDATQKCPVLLALHGAGVEASAQFWTNAYRQQKYAWTVFPTGRTPWGFDWHGPSHLNVEAALWALRELPGVPVDERAAVAVDIEKIAYSGHSNGGQGAWWMISHYPDKALAGLPASGYMKIQMYTPYYMRIGWAYSDPQIRAVLESSIAENDIDLYAANMAGIPIHARTGAEDDNVPPLHTRRIVRMVNEWNQMPNSIEFSEIPGQGHWFDGVVDDDETQQFLDRHIDLDINPGLPLPRLPDAFTIQTLNPASTGSKGGIRILQLEVPFRLGIIRVHRHGTQWIFNTTNVRRFMFVEDIRDEQLQSWSIDGTDFAHPPQFGRSYLRTEGSETWVLSEDLIWLSVERHPSTYGPIHQILNHPFRIVIPSNPPPEEADIFRKAAQHLAASWYLFGRGTTQIVRDTEVLDGLAARFNLIVLGGPSVNLYAKRREDEIKQSNLVHFLPSGGFQIANKKYELPGTGILFLAPSPTRARMGVFIAGTDEIGFHRALWSLPFRTGLTVPDYLVVGDEYGDPSTGWTAGSGNAYGGAGTKGTGGVFAAGYWNNMWEYDPRCGYLK
ncbi:uncharacterized protein BJ171DRAFT_514823 [Polychytrium aggregatum]|uniref:uncharacterized protein n=1 Tax=Polychytrium aggregatum TaxID=110093 RepID=UPI0022FE95E6|nr:uncharacterized protein BJ171DRAFT_514823 [Polychytrium aggregatum]KAI9202381.1 hypothetical protein BJ171DRAFT_514823 [Polychytrium aggregatum]